MFLSVFSAQTGPANNVTRVFIEPPTSIIYSSTGPRCSFVVWASATNAAAWLRHRTDHCACLLEKREQHGVSSPCDRRCMVCATVYLTVMPSFSDMTDVMSVMSETINHQPSATVSRPTEAAPPYFTSRSTDTTL